MAEKKRRQRKKPDGRGKRPRDPNQLAKWIVEQSVGDRSEPPRVSPPIGKGNTQTAPGPDAPAAKTEQTNPEEIPAAESEVPPGAHQEGDAATDKNTRLNNDHYREQDARVADGVTLPATDKGRETQKATGQPQNASNGQAPAKPTAIDQKRRHDCCMLAANIVIAVATTAYVIVALFQWSAMRGQLKAMSGQLEQMRDADRPWVGLAATDRIFNRLDSVPHFENEYAQVTCTIIPQNFGKSPAEVICCRTELIVTQDANDVAKRLDAIRSDPLPHDISHILFPETDRVMKRITPKATVPERVDVPNRDSAFEAYIIVYIAYRSPSGGEYHHSAFIYTFYDLENACVKRLTPPNNLDLLLAARDCEWQLYHTYTD